MDTLAVPPADERPSQRPWPTQCGGTGKNGASRRACRAGRLELEALWGGI